MVARRRAALCETAILRDPAELQNQHWKRDHNIKRCATSFEATGLINSVLEMAESQLADNVKFIEVVIFHACEK